MDTVQAPFTADQVASLNAYQASGVFHPFTCGRYEVMRDRPTDHAPTITEQATWECPGKVGSTLIATTNGWQCPSCEYTQFWAHDWMADWSWKAMRTASVLEAILQLQSDVPG